MHQHTLDAVFQSHRAAVACPACAAQLQQHLPVHETPEVNVSAVFLDCGSNACFEEFFDHADDFVVVLVVCKRVDFRATLALLTSLGFHSVDDRRAGCQCLVDYGEDFGLDVCPGCGRVFCHSDVVDAKEDACYAVDVHELCCEWRGVWRREGAAWGDVFEEGRGYRFGEDTHVGIELERLDMSASNCK